MKKKKPPTEEDVEVKERVQKALETRINELKARQYDRADAIERSLTDYEKNIRIRSVSDYVSLVKMQRTLIGLEDASEKGSFKFQIEFVKSGEKNI